MTKLDDNRPVNVQEKEDSRKRVIKEIGVSNCPDGGFYAMWSIGNEIKSRLFNDGPCRAYMFVRARAFLRYILSKSAINPYNEIVYLDDRMSVSCDNILGW